MKNSITRNLGLKIISLLAAFLLWLVVINVDDPIITKTFTGVPVEVLNEDALTKESQCYELMGNGTVNVVVKAKRTVVDSMSRDYLKATADLRSLNNGKVPIEVRALRLADRIESVTPKSDSIQVFVQDIISANVAIEVVAQGDPDREHLLSSATPSAKSTKVTGPRNVIEAISRAEVVVDVSDLSKNVTIPTNITLLDVSGDVISDDRIKLSRDSVNIEVKLNSIKTIPIVADFSGEPAAGYSIVGAAVVEPKEVLVAGSGENFEDLDAVNIEADKVSVTGAGDDVSVLLDISNALPSGVMFAEDSFNGEVTVTVDIDANERKVIDVPVGNILINNVPEGYLAGVVYGESTIPVEVEGLGEVFDALDGTDIKVSVDATKLVPRLAETVPAEGGITEGENDGQLIFEFPKGISETSPVYVMVMLEKPVDENAGAGDGAEPAGGNAPQETEQEISEQ